jgi:hypothetical protein
VKNVIRDDGDKEIGLGFAIEKESAPGKEAMWSEPGSFWPRLRISPRFLGIVPL